jgi:phenylacetate-coenzyme A ligase PaaK-like adenylate-forming protein
MQADRQFWNEDIETLSPQEMKALQWRRLKKQLQYNFDNSVYYRREKFEKAGLTPEAIISSSENKEIHSRPSRRLSQN